MIDLAPTGVDRQVSMIFGYDNGAQAYLNTTTGREDPDHRHDFRAKARIEIDGDFYAPSAFSVITQAGEARRFDSPPRVVDSISKHQKSLVAFGTDCWRVLSCRSMRPSRS